MKKIIVVFICLAWAKCFAQDSLKTARIIYADVGLGYSLVGEKGLVAVAALDYAQKRNLYTLKYDWLSPLLSGERIDQFGILYGKRIVSPYSSLNFSLGISRNYYFEKEVQWIFPSPNPKVVKYNYWGVPFEICSNGLGNKNYSRGRALKNTFIFRYSFKLHGNFSRNSFAAFTLAGIVGYH